MKRKFKNDDEYQTAVHEIEWKSRISYERFIDEMTEKMADIPHSTNALKDARFLLQLFVEKIEKHNGQCKQMAGTMKTSYYKRYNIEGY